MSSVVSKNLYELLGNDPELDPNREPEPPTKVADKPVARAGKRNGAAEGPARDATARPAAGGRGGRDQSYTGSEQAIRDKTAGAVNNRARPTDDGVRQDRHANRMREPNEHRDIGNRGRGSRGGGYGARGMRGTRTGRDDRHSRSGVGEHEKQAAKGWGPETAEGEFEAEKEGLQDAHEDEKDGVVATDTAPVDENGTPADQLPTAEEEDKTKSYEQYLAEQLEKRAALNDRPLETRQANEGSSKKFPEGKAFERNEAQSFFEGSGGKAARTRERKAKNVLDIDQTWVEASESASRGSERGGRGGRGGRGRGEGRGGRGGEGRGGRGGRGRGEGRGDFRGESRGGRGGQGGQPRGGAGVNLTDDSAFPSLGK